MAYSKETFYDILADQWVEANRRLVHLGRPPEQVLEQLMKGIQKLVDEGIEGY